MIISDITKAGEEVPVCLMQECPVIQILLDDSESRLFIVLNNKIIVWDIE